MDLFSKHSCCGYIFTALYIINITLMSKTMDDVTICPSNKEK